MGFATVVRKPAVRVEYPPLAGYVPKTAIGIASEIDKDFKRIQDLVFNPAVETSELKGERKFEIMRAIYEGRETATPLPTPTPTQLLSTPTPTPGTNVEQAVASPSPKNVSKPIPGGKPARAPAQEKLELASISPVKVERLTKIVGTLKEFSTPSMSGEPWYEMYQSYWGSKTYAEDMIEAALSATADREFSGSSDIVREQGVKKGIQIHSLWMYVVHQLEMGRKTCPTNRADALASWDLAWAYYAGSMAGTGEDPAQSGVFLYSVAQRRCREFQTCDDSGLATANSKLLELMRSGQGHIEGGECTQLRSTIDEAVKWMTVPLIQSGLKYAYRSMENPSSDRQGALYELDGADRWMYTSAFLPQAAAYDAEKAAMLRERMIILSGAKRRRTTRFTDVRQTMMEFYEPMDVSCSELGTYTDDDGTTLAAACENKSISVIGAVGIGLLAVAIVIFSLLCIRYALQRNKDKESKRVLRMRREQSVRSSPNAGE